MRSTQTALVYSFAFKNDGFCIKNDGFCLENDGFCRVHRVPGVRFHIHMMILPLKMMIFPSKVTILPLKMMILLAGSRTSS